MVYRKDVAITGTVPDVGKYGQKPSMLVSFTEYMSFHKFIVRSISKQSHVGVRVAQSRRRIRNTLTGQTDCLIVIAQE